MLHIYYAIHIVKPRLQYSNIYFINVTYLYVRNAMDKKQVSFRIEPDIIKRLKYVALDQDRSLTDVILEAIQDILKKYEKKPK